jgi:hypothetical protein
VSRNKGQKARKNPFVVSTKKLGSTQFKIVNDSGLFAVQIWENGEHDATIAPFPTLDKAAADLKKHIAERKAMSV